MRFAFETLIWGPRIEDLELVLDIIAACGYEGVEFGQPPDQICVRDPLEPEGTRPVRGITELLGLLRANGRNLTLVGLSGGTLRQRMTFCGEGFRPEYLYTDNWGKEAEDALRDPRPFTLGVHPHWFMQIERVEQARKLLDDSRREHPDGRNVLLLPDTAHLTIAEANPVDVVKEFIGRLAAIHFQDWTPSYGGYSQRYARGFVPLGEGKVDLPGVLRAMDSTGFDGWVVVEQDTTETTPARSAWQCAQWLAEHGKTVRSDADKLPELLEREAAAQRKKKDSAAEARELKLLQALVLAANHGTTAYYQAVVETFHSLGGLEAVGLYSYYPPNDDLYLLAVTGAPGTFSSRILKARASLCGDVTREQRVTSFALSAEDNAAWFTAPRFLPELRGKRMITVPIFNPSNAHHLRYLLNLFPSGQDFWGTPKELSELAIYVARIADHVADDICSAAANLTSYECGRSRSKKEFLVNLSELVQGTFNCEGVSIFLVSQSGDRLELAGTTGIEWDPKLKPHERFYPRGVGLTGATWASCQMRLVVSAHKEPDVSRRSWESPPNPDRDECLFMPLKRLGEDVVGVIRLVNKGAIDGSPAATAFTDDDVAVLDSIVQAALPHLELLQSQEKQMDAVTRMTHEFKVPMVAIRGAIDFMRHSLNERGFSPKEFFGENYLDDVIEWCNLMGRLANNARLFAAKPGDIELQLSRTHLMSEVVAPAVKQVIPILKERGFQADAISFGDCRDVPYLYIDRNQFQQVFFNLLSNSIKYADPGKLKVRIGTGKVGATFCIWFEDWGPGVEEGLENVIFEPGFRGGDAVRKDASGQGIGLSVVRTIVKAHGGSIRLKSNRLPTTFEISLPESLRYRWSPP